MLARSAKANLLVTVISAVIVFAFAELALRIFHPIRFMRPVRIETAKRRPMPIYIPSSVPGLPYELRPTFDGLSHKTRVRINRYGMRGREPLPPGDTTACNVLALGDSFTFGIRVAGDEAYPSVLESLLSRYDSGKTIQVLNLGVTGYTTQNEVAMLRKTLVDWKPGLIVIGYFFNDPEIDPTQPIQRFFAKSAWWQHLNVLRVFAQAKRDWDVMRLGNGDYFHYLHARDKRKWKSVVEGFEEIRGMAHDHGVHVILVVFPHTEGEPWSTYKYRDLHAQVLEEGRRNGFHVIDLYDVYSQYPPGDLIVDPENFHPSVLGHRLAAEAIYKLIEEDRLLDLRTVR